MTILYVWLYVCYTVGTRIFPRVDNMIDSGTLQTIPGLEQQDGRQEASAI